MDALIVVMDFDGAPADEFADWYDSEHLPERRALPGWLSGARYLAVGGAARSVALYDLDSVDALDTEDYRRLVSTGSSPWRDRIHRLRDAQRRPSLRYQCRQLSPGESLAPAGPEYLYLARMNVAPEVEDEFNNWYDEEHLPALAAVPGVRAARRFRALNSDDRLHRYLATYHLDSPDTVTSPQWRDALRTRRTRQIWPQVLDVDLALFRLAGTAAWTVRS
ncbi:hypothetical protein O7627_34215 [Solwaraspora sp. WMMD1047]|uniref:DUF4286 family protein n=1 Tax=Solwaraspora sp. WMMD1047 TaxID=3016102 RepID=UPI002417B888|nr:DUF4286 family protein [Solwaraspora sp. WMMD1047]MDG4834324.1 hypothetical protein [Solwaraspora sp. WMMD1047]